jgi:hypothetical protein
LLKEMEKAKGGRPAKTPSTAEGVLTLADRGVSEGQSHRWQKLADVPDEQFEAALDGPEMPTTNSAIGAPQPREIEVNPVAMQSDDVSGPTY